MSGRSEKWRELFFLYSVFCNDLLNFGVLTVLTVLYCDLLFYLLVFDVHFICRTFKNIIDRQGGVSNHECKTFYG